MSTFDEFDIDLPPGSPPEKGSHPSGKGKAKPTKAEQERHHNEAVPDEAGKHGKEPKP